MKIAGKVSKAVIYARVSSKDQEREGYSIPAQLKLLREYAATNGFKIEKEFIDVESAKVAGRKQFGLMLRFLEQNPESRTVIVEKTDRLYRNFRDSVTLEDLGVELHLAKEAQIIGKDSKSQSKLIHGIQLVIARNYIDNLREEVKKGMREKAEQGIYPSRPPLGYRNNKLQRTIEVDPATAPRAKRMFELYASGVSLSSVGAKLRTEFGVSMAKGYIDRLLKNPFYQGSFEWQGTIYQGTHQPLIDRATFDQVQEVFRSHNKPKYRRHEFAFGGLLNCAYDGCTITAEIKKGKYTYYRCTGHRGKCELPYFREEQIAQRLGSILDDIHVPDDVLSQLLAYLRSDDSNAKQKIEEQRQRLDSRLSAIQRRLEQVYLDKLDGKISEDFWLRKQSEWQREEDEVKRALEALQNSGNRDFVPTAQRILELANKASFLYVSQTDAEKAKLLKMVVSNCTIDAVSVYPTYRKPFQMILERAKTKEWCARKDSNFRPSGS